MRQSHIKFTFTFCVVLALTVIESASAEQFSDWSPPVSLGPIINTEFDDSGTFISRDGLRLYFNSTCPGGFGGSDIYVSTRKNKRNDFAGTSGKPRQGSEHDAA